MKELVEQIDAHPEPDDTEASSILNTWDQLNVDPLFSMADQQQTRPDPQHDLLVEPYFYSFSLPFLFLLHF